MNTASEQIPAYDSEPRLRAVENQPLQYLRIGVPQSVLTPQQLTELAGIVRRYSPRHTVRLRSATQLEVAILPTQRPPEPLLSRSETYINTRRSVPEGTGVSALRVHVPGAQLRVRQLRVLAALMHLEDLRTIRIIDSETLIIENVWHSRAAVLQLGLREAGLITR